MRKRLEIKPGDRYGRLTILADAGIIKGRRRFLCKCDCGKETAVNISYLNNGNTRSCGCLREMNSITHGQYYTALYRVWASMKSRCFNSHQQAYPSYGGRGITVCNEWLTFEPFRDWAMAHGYSRGLTIERNNNNRDYEPSNCKWVALERQANNRRSSRFITHNGKSMTLADWSREVGIDQINLAKRLKRGWSVYDTLTTPLGRKVNND